LKKILLAFLVVFLGCGGGGGGGGGVTEPTGPLPVANFTGDPVSGVVPLTVNFVSTSTDATTHIWDFDNNGTDDATGVSWSIEYTAVGSYSVKLTVTGPGGSDVMIRPNYITVLAQPPPVPVASFTATPVSGTVPLTVNFVSTSTDATTHIWDFDNNGTDDATGSSISHQYTAAGTYSVNLTVTGPGGTDSITETDYITVNENPPHAAFTGTPTSGTPDLRVEFANTSVRYTQLTWDFGDGGSSTEENPIYTYTATGSYDVSLTAVGPGGTDVETKSSYINISTLATPAIILDPKYTDTSNGSTITLSLKVMGVTGLAAAQVKLVYDTSKATIGDVAFGDFLKGNTDPLLIVTKDESNGEVTIYTSSLSSDKPSADGDGIIATVEFTVTSTTSIIFDNSNIVFLDVGGNNITVNGSTNGYIYVE
jgi:PKD repeat protein